MYREQVVVQCMREMEGGFGLYLPAWMLSLQKFKNDITMVVTSFKQWMLLVPLLVGHLPW